MKIQLIKAIKNDPDHARKQVEAKEMLQKLYPDAEIWTPDEICENINKHKILQIEKPIYHIKYTERDYAYLYIVHCLAKLRFGITHFFDVDKYNGENFESNGKIIECAFCAEIGVEELIVNNMNREIKFRAFVNNEMHDVISIDFIDQTVTLSDGDIYKISKVELLQNTGMKDKNGKEIYEDDLIICDLYNNINKNEKIILRIIYDNPNALFCAEVRNGVDIVLYELDDIELIGNKFENPELLEATK